MTRPVQVVAILFHEFQHHQGRETVRLHGDQVTVKGWGATHGGQFAKAASLAAAFEVRRSAKSPNGDSG
jgi:hypothetical protein